MFLCCTISYSHLKDLIRKQLIAEYGVDPLSDALRNGPKGDEITNEELQAAMDQLSMT